MHNIRAPLKTRTRRFDPMGRNTIVSGLPSWATASRKWFLEVPIKYIVYKEERYYVSQCLNVDISSFGESVDEAISNLKEALELYFEKSLQ